ncbi:MAG: hypothetical protein LAO07_04845 [Acidobacteriia bacterium]|nr:hypothetical protein [Terriglobia bacterium]
MRIDCGYQTLPSAALGKQVAALLDTETAGGAIHESPLQKIAVVSRVGDGALGRRLKAVRLSP